ncbi:MULTISPECIES: FAD/NAD(P)-binding protein [unclassified Bartonella]|uniref:FAD/NAD(P)-binding protein n=1 Tax=unclassified Bartonella TaxID=2645622 RepID=UPI0035CEAEFD
MSVKIGIIGCGLTGLCLLERVLGWRKAGFSNVSSVHIFDLPNRFGGGVHYRGQAVSNHLNRTAGQLSFGADHSHKMLIQHINETTANWTLFSRCIDKYSQTKDDRYLINEQSWVDRSLLGEIAFDVFNDIISTLRNLSVQVTIVPSYVEKITIDDSEVVIQTSSESLRLSHVVLCTGHSEQDNKDETANLSINEGNKEGGWYLSNIFPVEGGELERFETDSSVAIRGMGLVCLDAILKLTEGRGGYFYRDENFQLLYKKSGLEPKKIYPFSRNGFFNFARPFDEKIYDHSLVHTAIIFNHDLIKRMRESRGNEVGQLDFTRDILPALILESAIIYYSTIFGKRFIDTNIKSIQFIINNHINTVGELKKNPHTYLADQLNNVANDFFKSNPEIDYSKINDGLYDDKYSRFDSFRFAWLDIIEPKASKDFNDKHLNSLSALYNDIYDAKLGNIKNPRKAAIDGAWRDLRNVLRNAVEFGGLTAASHREFVDIYFPLINRITVGTSLKVMEKIAALATAKIVDLSESKAPNLQAKGGKWHLGNIRSIDYLVNARIPRFSLKNSRNNLLKTCFKDGILREWSNDLVPDDMYMLGGVDIHPITHACVYSSGQISKNVFIIGPPTEGPHYFRSAAVRPNTADPLPIYADKILASVLNI